MLLCGETITLLHPLGDGSYSCTVIAGASWYAVDAAAEEDCGLRQGDQVRVRIPQASFGGTVYIGDYLARGKLETAASSDALQAYPHCKIYTVTDNRGRRNPHWAVIGA